MKDFKKDVSLETIGRYIDDMKKQHKVPYHSAPSQGKIKEVIKNIPSSFFVDTWKGHKDLVILKDGRKLLAEPIDYDWEELEEAGVVLFLVNHSRGYNWISAYNTDPNRRNKECKRDPEMYIGL